MDSELTLEKATIAMRQAESIMKQQSLLRNDFQDSRESSKSGHAVEYLEGTKPPDRQGGVKRKPRKLPSMPHPDHHQSLLLGVPNVVGVPCMAGSNAQPKMRNATSAVKRDTSDQCVGLEIV